VPFIIPPQETPRVIEVSNLSVRAGGKTRDIITADLTASEYTNNVVRDPSSRVNFIKHFSIRILG